jgi:hypothetical protein
MDSDANDTAVPKAGGGSVSADKMTSINLKNVIFENSRMSQFAIKG